MLSVSSSVLSEHTERAAPSSAAPSVVSHMVGGIWQRSNNMFMTVEIAH